MAEQVTNDVVKEAQSMGRPTPIDATATTTNNFAGDGEATSSPANAKHNSPQVLSTSTNATNADTAPAESTRAEKIGANAVTAPDDLRQSDLAPKEARERLVNGDSAEHSAAESQPTPGDASGGSDTDISRPGSVDQAKRAAGHLRSNSVKKPTSFKSVSVTKNFLAKSAVAAPAVRSGEKAAPSGQVNTSTLQTARPRLVAKSGAGNVHRSLSKMNGAGSGPDASKVWNKNQPVPPPPPKQFTDEELKQQYGIHLATRLQADEAGKEAKWADIDDDEDDWAPDTVQWMDGTKSTVTAVETTPPPVEEPKPDPKTEAPTESPKPAPAVAANPQNQSATGGTKTILKPGAHVQSGPTKTGLVLKGQPEKPTLVAKPSAPTPVKSPWAILPPVEKISPVQINPPPPQHSPRFSHRDLHHGYDAPPPPLTKEIAPDDFNRSWRDDRGNRELFNSHSGRYEPVNEMRRGSMRDSYRQQPAVLQRPAHEGPAEPSAAFQTSRTSADAPAWGRRRNSSNVSGGTGRRMSIDRRGPDMPSGPMNIQRRESQSINGLENDPRHALAQKGGPPHPIAADQRGPFAQAASPGLSQVQPVSPFGSVTSSSNLEVATPNATVPMESAVEAQKRLMAEKLERARLKKQKDLEEEKKAEAEKQERLAKKLAAMGLPPSDLKPKTKDLSPSRGLERSPQKEKVLPAPVQSPPKPPVPTSEGEVAQYGMMKVHQPQPVKKPFHSDASKSIPKPSASPVKAHAESHIKAAPHPPQPTPPFNRDNHNRDHNLNRDHERNKSQVEQSEGSISQGLKATQAPQAAWSTTTLPQQSRPWTSNVWGPPQAKDRALGNGTFDSGYNRGQPRPGSQQLPTQPSSGPATSIGLTPTPKGSVSQPPNQSFAQQTMYSKTPLPAQADAAPKPGPIAPLADNGWGNFAAHIRRDDQEVVAKARRDLERIGEQFRPELREKYTDQKGQSQATMHDKVAKAALPDGTIKSKVPSSTGAELKAKDDINKSTHEGSPAQQPAGQGTHLPAATQGPRSSRFFPRPTEAAAQPSTSSSKTDSPPPPETESHPAFTGDSTHPLVRLPKPSPVVRLPPPATDYVAQPEPPVSMPSRARLGLGARPLALDPEWQARFNSLLEKAPAATPAPAPKASAAVPSIPHTKGSSLAIAASSKAPLEVREAAKSATVSLPNTIARKPFVEDGSSEVITRESPEDILLEDREFGSLPIVKPPKMSHLAANEPPVGFPPSHRPQSRFQRNQLDIFTKPTFDIVTVEREREKGKEKPTTVPIRLANMKDTITKPLVQRRQGSRRGFGQSKPKRTSTPNGTPTNQNRNPRKSSFQGQGTNTGSSPRSSGTTSWSNNRSTPQQNNSSWARRAAAPVH